MKTSSIRLIDVDQRKGKHCFFCGATKSVKYEVKFNFESAAQRNKLMEYSGISEVDIDPNEMTIHVCNKCMATKILDGSDE